jgi:hypothetical protein
MTNTITDAAQQWATRPVDERFWTLQEARVAAEQHAANAVETVARPENLRVEAHDNSVKLIGANGQSADFSHFSFGQFCRTVSAPADYLRRLPAQLAAHNLDEGIKLLDDPAKDQQLMFHQQGDALTLRSYTSDRYSRVWNWELADRLLPYTNQGWRVPPALAAVGNDPRARPAIAEDLIEGNRGGNQLRVGDMIAPAGVYVSDHDCFFFLVNPERSFGEGDRYMRGMIWRNSEVGDGALIGLAFIFDGVCGNHIIWGVQESLEFRLRHVGEVQSRWGEARVKIRSYADRAGDDEMTMINRAKAFSLGDDRDKASDYLYGKKALGLTKKQITAGLDRAEEHADWYGDPLSAWGFVSGLTEMARDLPHGDKRAAMEMAGGKVLREVAF